VYSRTDGSNNIQVEGETIRLDFDLGTVACFDRVTFSRFGIDAKGVFGSPEEVVEEVVVVDVLAKYTAIRVFLMSPTSFISNCVGCA